MADETDDDLPPIDDGADLLGDEPAVDKPARTPRKAKAAVEERLHPILSNEEYRAAQDEARAKIDKERKLAAKKAVVADETDRLRREEGLTTGIGAKDEEVSVTVDLPSFTPSIMINRFPYWHGRTYQVPRHVADTLAEQMSRAWRHEDQIDGKSLTQTYARKRDTVINARTGAVANAPARFDA